MICQNCHTSNPAESRLCRSCGAVLPILCPNCEHQNPPGSKFCNNCGHRLIDPLHTKGSEPPSRASSPDAPFIPAELAAKLEAARASGAMAGERRVVTILFCDVQGSTTAASQLDPEEWAGIMNGTFERMIRPVYKYEGTVARLMGDAILAFFGAPIAHEDDPQRAILAGLEILDAMKPHQAATRDRWGVDFGVRVGINTGLVMVGAIGSDLRMEYTAMGDAINLAARMEQTAEPGTIQVSENTYRLAAPLFEWQELGEIPIKGKVEPVRTYRPLERLVQPGQLRGIEGAASPLIGRTAEMDLLHTALRDLHAGRGGIVFLIGEAGLGKSRLIQEAHSIWQGEDPALGQPPHWIEQGATSYQAALAYGMIKGQLRRIFGLKEGTAPDHIRRRLEAWTRELPENLGAAFITIATRLFAAEIDSETPPDADGETFKKQLFAVMAQLFRTLYARHPGILVLDDLHWADIASMALIEHLYHLVETVPILFLCATRPERGEPGWKLKTAAETNYPHRYSEIILQPLTLGDSGALVNSLLTVSELPDPLQDLILAKAEGNPFFVEEIIRELIDEQVITRQDNRWRIARQVKGINIPDNIQALLAARIDRLEPETRQVLQLASVIGRSFIARVLRKICGDSIDLDAQLAILQQAQMVAKSAGSPDPEYRFRHALTQETAYRSILRAQRRDFHRQVGETIADLFPDHIKENAAVLAHHFSQAGDNQQSLKYHALAAREAFALYANSEAILHYDRAIALLKEDPALTSAPGAENIANLYQQKGRAMELAGQFDAALENYLEMEAQSQVFSDRRMELAAVIAQAILRCTPTVLFEARQGAPLAARAMELAEALNDQAAIARILWIKMHLHRILGEIKKAYELGKQSLSLARKLNLQEQTVYTLHDLGYVLSEMGRVSESMHTFREAAGMWREMSNRTMLADNLAGNTINLFFAGQYEQAITAADEAFRISQETHNTWGQSFSKMNLGFIYRDLGEYDRGIAAAEASLQYGDHSGFFVPKIFCPAQIALMYGDLGFFTQGARIARKLMEQADESPYMETQVLGLVALAHNLLASGDNESAIGLNIQSTIDRFDEEFGIFLFSGSLSLCIHLAQNNPKQALSLSEELLERANRFSARAMVPELLFLQGQAFLDVEKPEAAYQALDDARRRAMQINQRRTLWKILGKMAELHSSDGNVEAAQAFLEQARETLKFVIAHVPPDLRSDFLSLPEVNGIRRA